MPNVDKKDNAPSWRLSIQIPGAAEIILSFLTRDAAAAEAEKIVAQGYARHDRSSDASVYDAVVYPIAQIQSMHIYEKK